MAIKRANELFSFSFFSNKMLLFCCLAQKEEKERTHTTKFEPQTYKRNLCPSARLYPFFFYPQPKRKISADNFTPFFFARARPSNQKGNL
jgi:hypothetical protein